MQRIKFIRHLVRYGCILIREGAKHSIFVNPRTLRTTAVPRHKELSNFTARQIYKDLSVPFPKK